MRVFILTLGTRGDFEPFWALGRELHARGHAVTIGTSTFHAEPGSDPELTWVPIGSGTRPELMAVLHSLGTLERGGERAQAFLQRWLLPQLRAGAAQISLAGDSSDYFICNLKIPLRRRGQVLPGAFISYDPPDAVENLSRFGSHKHGGRIIELVAMNRALVDPNRQWGEDFHFTGFWTPPLRDHRASATLQRFLETGSAPVVLTMGSMVTFDSQRLAQDFCQALRRIARRGVLVGGWSGFRPGHGADDDVLVIRDANYDALFAQAACVVHHGGVGTVAAALRAGVPSILLPQLGSQEAFGQLLRREQLCTGVFDTDSLDPAALAAAIRQAIDDPAIRVAAQRWRTAVHEDGGMPMAADLIEAHWAQIDQHAGASNVPGASR